MVGGLPPEVDVILPCLHEAEAFDWVLGRMPPAVRPIVVDNGSTDGSVVIAHDGRAAGWRCVAGSTIRCPPTSLQPELPRTAHA